MLTTIFLVWLLTILLLLVAFFRLHRKHTRLVRTLLDYIAKELKQCQRILNESLTPTPEELELIQKQVGDLKDLDDKDRKLADTVNADIAELTRHAFGDRA